MSMQRFSAAFLSGGIGALAAQRAAQGRESSTADAAGQGCQLLSKDTLTRDARGEPIRRFRFRTPDGKPLNVNTALRQVVVINGKMYSPAAEWADGTFDLVIRVYKNGNVSQFLDSLRIGDRVQMRYPFPPLHPDRHNAGKRVGLVAYGVGISEMVRVAENELSNRNVKKVHMIYATRDHNDQVLLPELSQLVRAHPKRFALFFAMSRGDVARDGLAQRTFNRRVDPSMLAEVFPWQDELMDNVRFFSSGSRDMMRDLDAMLESLGWDKEQYQLIRSMRAGGGGDRAARISRIRAVLASR